MKRRIPKHVQPGNGTIKQAKQWCLACYYGYGRHSPQCDKYNCIDILPKSAANTPPRA